MRTWLRRHWPNAAALLSRRRRRRPDRPLVRPRLGRKRLLWVLTAAWLVFYAAFFALMPN